VILGRDDLRGSVELEIGRRFEETPVDELGVLLHRLEVLVDVAPGVLIEPLTEQGDRLLVTFTLREEFA
jgi:hypothetical protein